MLSPDSSPLVPIGVVRSGRVDRRRTPVQAQLNPDETARVDVYADFREALAGLDGFEFAWLLCWLGRDRGEPIELTQVPFLLRPSERRIGVFAMRGPHRPNPIGLSLVRIMTVDADGFGFTGVDMVDGTTVIDVKPYVTAFDSPGRPVRCGWVDEVSLRAGSVPADGDGSAELD